MSSMYVIATPCGELGRRLQEAEQKFSGLNLIGWTNLVERRDKRKDLVGNKYPWAEVTCSRPDCLMQV